MIKYLKSIFFIIIVSYSILLLYVFLNQKNFIFFPEKGEVTAPEFLKIKDVYIDTSDGEKLHAWWLPIDEKARTVIFFHGNAGNLSDRVNQMNVFSDLGLNALMIDYRGYGKSSGEINKEQDVYTDGQAVLNYLDEINIPNENIILWGRSLGGAVAIELAQERKIAAVIVESSMYSGLELAKKYYWFMPVKYLLKYNFESYKKIKKIHSPILIMHGLNDEVMPYEQGIKLFEAANEPKEFFELKGGHNTGLYETYDDYIVELKKFLKL